MKKNTNKLKLITLILLVILITMVGFFGVYTREKGNMKNDVKDYAYTMNLDGSQVITLRLSTAKKQVIKDKDGNVVKNATEEEIEQNGYIKEEEPINKDENKTHENYDLTKQIIKTRLEKIGVSNYVIRVDEVNENIIIELPKDDELDNIINIITTPGKFEIVDADTDEVLLSKDNINESNIYRNTTSAGTEMSFSIELDGEGAKKLEEISKTYVPEKEDSEEKTDDNATEESTEKTTEETSDDTSTKENKEKKVSFKLDDSELLSLSFDEPVTSGKLYLTVGEAATTSDEIKSKYEQVQRLTSFISTKTMPLNFNQDSNTFIQSPNKEGATDVLLIGSAIVIGVVIALLTLIYKGKGILVGICFAGFSAILLLTVRYWNVSLSIEGVVAIFGILLLNFVFVNKILRNLKNEEDNKKVETKHEINMAIKDSTLKLIPLFIMAVVFAFANWQSTSSFGMVMFWGLSLIELYNLLITKYVLKFSKK